MYMIHQDCSTVLVVDCVAGPTGFAPCMVSNSDFCITMGYGLNKI